MKRSDFFEQLSKNWISENEKFFGVPSEGNNFLKKDILDEYSMKYWNNKNTRCRICELLFESDTNNMSTFVEYSPTNLESGFFIESSIDYNIIYGWFRENSKNKVYPVFLIPKILKTLEWKIGRAVYIPRGVVERNSTTLGKIDNQVILPGYFRYNCETGELREYKEGNFSSNNLDDLSLKYITAFCPDFKKGEDVETFKKHLEELPDTKYNDIINYRFYDYHFFFNKLEKSILRVNPTVKKFCNICSMLVNLGRNANNSDSKGKIREEEGDCTLILNSERSNIYSMGNFRSVLYSPKFYSQNFFFKNTEIFFDAFKTSTSKTAGKIRTLLDDVHIGSDGLLYKTLPNGEVINQFEAYKRFHIDGDLSVKTSSLSCLSKTLYCNNNDPKRIMMTSKSIGQSIPVPDEYDITTHSVLARVVFGDFFGFTNGDALVIRRGFADRMISSREEKIFVSSSNKDLINIIHNSWDFENNTYKRPLTLEEFSLLMGYFKNNFNRCHNIRITDIKEIKRNYGNTKSRKGFDVLIKYDIPVKTGDKFTNQHGSKGVIALIVDDDKMPRLTKKCGVMEPGPFDIIISSFGITKRTNIGQICEAFSRMKGIDEEIPLKELFADIEDYSGPLVEYNGELTEKCFGLQEILRLQHLSLSHASFSGIDKVTNFMLNFGEQENLFLLAHGFASIQKEINQRSPKYFNRKGNINNLIVNKTLINDESLSFNMELLGIFHSLGFDVKISDAVDSVDGFSTETNDYDDEDTLDLNYNYDESSDEG